MAQEFHIEFAPRTAVHVEDAEPLGEVQVLVERVAGNPTQEQINIAVAQYIEEHPGILSPLSPAVKAALLQIADKALYVDDGGPDYYDALEAAFSAKALLQITAVYTQTGTVYDTDSLDDLKNDLVVTALYSDSTTEVVTSGYILSGTLTAGTSTITVSYSGQLATFTVTVTHYEVPALYRWDFTQSLIDSEQSQEALLSPTGVSQSSDGLSFTGAAGLCLLGTNVFSPGRTLEVDIASVTANIGSNHGRLIMFADTSTVSVTNTAGNGFIYRSTGKWGFYKGSWSDGTVTDINVFAGKTLRMKYYYSSDDSKYHTDVYADNTLVKSYATTKKWNTTGINPVQIGCGQYAFKNMVVTGARIYEGVD